MLIRLPCEIGAKLYWINVYCPTPRIEEYEVIGFKIGADYKIAIIVDFEEQFFWQTDKIFFSKREAEKKLEEFKKELNKC